MVERRAGDGEVEGWLGGGGCGKGVLEGSWQGTGGKLVYQMGPCLGRVLGQQCGAGQKKLLCAAAGVLPCEGPKALNKKAA